MNEELILRQEELVENPTARLPVCLVLDTSASMSGPPINELQEGVNTFYCLCSNDPHVACIAKCFDT